MSLSGAVEVFGKKLVSAPFIMYDNKLKPGHSSTTSVRTSCFKNGNNLFYHVGNYSI